MKNIRNRKGFTLIEILIVVVIIGILASLILPRMLAQPERAVTAEALNYLGVIRRAQMANAQPTGAYISADSGDIDGTPAPNANWTALGMNALPTSSRFTYACTGAAQGSGATCTATRNNVGGASKNGGTMTMNLDTGFISACDGTIYVLQNATNTVDARCV